MMKQKLSVMLCVLSLLFCSLLFVGCSSAVDYRDVKTSTETYLQSKISTPTYGDEWVILGLARGDAEVDSSFYAAYYDNLEKVVTAAKGELNNRKYTEYARVILALTSIGKDPTDVGGYNLVEKLSDFDAVKMQGINGPIFALIALDCGGYGDEAQRNEYIDYIIRQEIEGGGFALMGDAPNSDLTAMAVQALAPYTKSEKTVQSVVERALAYLDTVEETSAESLAQTITAKSAMGIDAETEIDALLAYCAPDGGFCHELPEGDESAKADSIATEQGYYALVAYDRFVNGQSSLYDMR